MNDQTKEIIGRYFPVLDSGFISLVDIMGSDESIERAARVSYGVGTRKTSETRGLLRYLIRQKHTSPLEQLCLTFHVGLPVFIARQWIRHRTFSFNEYSGRYSVMPTIFYTPDHKNLTTQATNNKQGRSDNLLNEETYQEIQRRLNSQREQAVDNYKYMLDNDVARELARIDLPLSMYTYWYCTVDLHNLFHFLKLRCDSHAQWEIRAYANLMAGMAKRVAPHAFEGWLDYVHLSSNFTRLDKKFNIHLMEYARNYSFNRAEWGSRIRPTYDDIRNAYSKADDDYHTEIGMSSRELDEFWQKMKEPEVPNFDLDLSVSKDGSYFEEIINNAS